MSPGPGRLSLAVLTPSRGVGVAPVRLSHMVAAGFASSGRDLDDEGSR